MKIVAISASQVPSITANSIQVIKACQAISQLGHAVHLYVPDQGLLPGKFEYSSYYGFSPQFAIEWLPSRPGFHRYDLAYRAVRLARYLNAEITYVFSPRL